MLYPISLDLKGKRVIVIGGGEVAERKVAKLVECEARVAVISPEVTPRLEALAATQVIELHRRPYANGDCAEAFLVFCATDDPGLHQAIWEESRRGGGLVNTADDPERCDFAAPAVVRRGDLTVAISTNGKSPAVAAHLRQQLSGLIGPEYAELLDILGKVRPEIRRRVGQPVRRKELHYRIIANGIIRMLQRRDREGAEQMIREVIEEYSHEEQPTK